MYGSVKVHLTQEEQVRSLIPDFNLQANSASEIAAVLQEKFNWLQSILPELREREIEREEGLDENSEKVAKLYEALALTEAKLEAGIVRAIA